MSTGWSARHRRRYGILVVAAALALLQPLFTPLAPQLASWLPGHQHVYVNGVTVEHTHPWDTPTGDGNEATHAARDGFVFHLCDIHPDGWVPVGTTSSATATDASSTATASDADSDAGEVVFTFDLGASTVGLPGLGPDLAPCRGELVLTAEQAAAPVTAPDGHPVPPPPRA